MCLILMGCPLRRVAPSVAELESSPWQTANDLDKKAQAVTRAKQKEQKIERKGSQENLDQFS